VDGSPVPSNLPLDSSGFQNQATIWRANRIERFTARQQGVREWISFAEIAEWCSREDGSIVPNESKRAAAFDLLQTEFLAGEFEENGRSRVLYLHPAIAKARISRQTLKDAIDHNHDDHRGRSQYLPYCWIPRPMFDRWLTKHRLPEAPARFRPRKSLRLSAATSGGRPLLSKLWLRTLWAIPN
jgi:hypothetical protein